ncbi:MAG: hypothetical protein ACXWE0_02310, partial [Nitrososphaeraceae archaeon]
NATEGTENATEGAREQIKETVSGAKSAATNATEDAQRNGEDPIEIGKNFLDQIWGKVTNLFK